MKMSATQTSEEKEEKQGRGKQKWSRKIRDRSTFLQKPTVWVRRWPLF